MWYAVEFGSTVMAAQFAGGPRCPFNGSPLGAQVRVSGETGAVFDRPALYALASLPPGEDWSIRYPDDPVIEYSGDRYPVRALP